MYKILCLWHRCTDTVHPAPGPVWVPGAWSRNPQSRALLSLVSCLCWETHWSTEMWKPTLSPLSPSITTSIDTLYTACQSRTPCFTCSINDQPSWLDVFHLFPIFKDLLWQWHSMGTWVRPNVSPQNRQDIYLNNKCHVANDQGHSSPHTLTGQKSPQNISSDASIHTGQVYLGCSHQDP